MCQCRCVCVCVCVCAVEACSSRAALYQRAAVRRGVPQRRRPGKPWAGAERVLELIHAGAGTDLSCSCTCGCSCLWHPAGGAVQCCSSCAPAVVPACMVALTCPSLRVDAPQPCNVRKGSAWHATWCCVGCVHTCYCCHVHDMGRWHGAMEVSTMCPSLDAPQNKLKHVR
jgi:hypothetical protein